MTNQLNEEQKAMLSAVAQGYVSLPVDRAPILATPTDYGLEFEDVKYMTEDGLELAGWFIPKDGSDKLIICNHPATLNRYGFPGHKAPWSDFQNIEVKFGNVYKALHDAGYNVLTYDLRGHGESDASKENKWGQGFSDEHKDVIATFEYVRSRDDLKEMIIGLFNPCAGGNAAFYALTKHPEYAKKVKAFVCAQPASINIMSRVAVDGMGLSEHFEFFASEIEKNIGIKLEDMTPHKYVQNFHIPTFIIQNKEDIWTVPADVQTTFDLIPTANKKLHWIENGDTRRFIGYNYCGEYPEQMIEWFDTYMNA
ncbi:hypothetical protein tloyanaT_35760 [Thalassotalea loyana]|uniref:Serine aminopeptidase S33 domain-containing protein n=1 Tax=Thalassotalea loyana TaxID=280483 RepID=A0ABQ6HGU5_9GAMM|nr:alpha/beta fold hydrolase [Thalassotalea loyana]GLX87323.1 hypothetical protein tloyanaT_35760 [Thalassotalea loyana]